MFTDYYQQQLARLRDRAREFARAHPSIAPQLSGPTSDPDVERLLEGTAFLCGMIQEKIDDDFPEIVHGLIDVVFPHLLRPVPSASIATFAPKPSLTEPLRVASGTLLGSKALEGVRCLFRTCSDVELLPLRLDDIDRRHASASEESITLRFSLEGMDLSQWTSDRLRFHVAGDYSQAADLLLAVCRHTTRVRVRSTRNPDTAVNLGAGAVSTPMFDLSNSLMTMPAQSFRGYGLLAEYFILPQKFLFLEVSGLKSLARFGTAQQFELEIVVKRDSSLPATVRKEHFTLFAVPVVNLFPHDADPVQVDHHSEELAVRPSGWQSGHYSVYSVDDVTGFRQGTVERRTYLPLDRFHYTGQSESGTYQILRRRSLADNRPEVRISLAYDRADTPQREVLSISLTCTNGNLPERLQVGDIREPTSQSPELASFRNIISPTPQVEVNPDDSQLWRLLSHVSLNFLPMADAEGLRELLRLYVFGRQRNDSRVVANLKRIDAVQRFETEPANRLLKGAMMRGLRMRLTAAGHDFAGPGDLFVFGSVLERFMALFASMNTFVQLELHNSSTGETIEWTPRIGEKTLI